MGLGNPGCRVAEDLSRSNHVNLPHRGVVQDPATLLLGVENEGVDRSVPSELEDFLEDHLLTGRFRRDPETANLDRVDHHLVGHHPWSYSNRALVQPGFSTDNRDGAVVSRANRPSGPVAVVSVPIVAAPTTGGSVMHDPGLEGLDFFSGAFARSEADALPNSRPRTRSSPEQDPHREMLLLPGTGHTIGSWPNNPTHRAVDRQP